MKNPGTMRYQLDERPPFYLAFGLGVQFAVLIALGIILTPAIVVRAGGGSEEFVSWAVFAAAAICGATTILQTVRIGRVGAGYVLAMGTSGAFIAICVAAIAKGGPGMLGTLVAISALFQFALAARLSLFRRVLTPTVAGTVIMLIPVTVMPIIADMLVPPGETEAAAICAGATIAVILAVAFKSRGMLRLWAPVFGVITGSVIGAYYGLYDFQLVAAAGWIGLPQGNWPGLDLEFGPVFWSLLPGFILVTLVGAVETIGDGVAIQRVSWRRKRAIDFRAVQGAVAADGVGNLLSGLAATVPNTTYSTSVPVAELTGVAARRVGIMLGAIFICGAFLPKALAVILAIPTPVAGAYIAILLSSLFVLGMRIVVEGGLDFRKGLIAGISFWVGVGCELDAIFPEYLTGIAGGLFDSGMTAGALTAIVLTLFLEITQPRRRRMQTRFAITELPAVRQFVGEFARREGWQDDMVQRLDAAVEETLLTMLHEDEDATSPPRRLLLTAHREEHAAELEFIAAVGEENLEDRISLMSERAEEYSSGREVSLRLLRHLATSVHHQQYEEVDIITIRVEAPTPE
ncbi:MAG: hypothetical protein OXF74_01970 [Rhodobacteraceae bacterium]|nr:hypothetical protein [Paracoccaceae bacterium]